MAPRCINLISVSSIKPIRLINQSLNIGSANPEYDQTHMFFIKSWFYKSDDEVNQTTQARTPIVSENNKTSRALAT